MKKLSCLIGFHSWRPLQIAPDFNAWPFFGRNLVDWHCVECEKFIKNICPNWHRWNFGMPLLGFSQEEWLLTKNWRAYIISLRNKIEWDCT